MSNAPLFQPVCVPFKMNPPDTSRGNRMEGQQHEKKLWYRAGLWFKWAICLHQLEGRSLMIKNISEYV